MTTKKITIRYGSTLNVTVKVREIKVDPKCSWHTCQHWFNKNMRKSFLEGKYGDRLNITWYDNHNYEFKLKRSKN